MDKKVDSKVIIGNVFLIMGITMNLLVIFPLGFIFSSIFLGLEGTTFSLFFILVALMNFIIGLIAYVVGILILYLNRNKYKFFKTNMILLFVIHLIISLGYALKFTLG